MKSIFIVSLFGEINNLNSRVYKIATAFSQKVTFVTPDFSHGEKKYKSKVKVTGNSLFCVKYISVPRYDKNLSFNRIFSHLVFALKLRTYLKTLPDKPGMIYCMMPPSSSAFVCGKFCKKNNIPFIVDVIDLWPDSLIPLVHSNKIINVLLYPWKHMTNEAYRMASYISGESKAYASIAHTINPFVPWSYTYLGVNIKQTQKLVSESTVRLEKPHDEIWICYGGSLGASYDFDSILHAVRFIQEKKIKYKMIFIGEGAKRIIIEEFAFKNKLNITITGRVVYKDFLKYLSVCDIGINSFKKNSLVAHSFKFNDYVATNLFILNNLEGETAEMIIKYNIGLNFNEYNLPDVLYDVCQNWDAYSQYKLNHNLLVKNELDSVTIYQNLASNILELIK